MVSDRSGVTDVKSCSAQRGESVGRSRSETDLSWRCVILSLRIILRGAVCTLAANVTMPAGPSRLKSLRMDSIPGTHFKLNH